MFRDGGISGGPGGETLPAGTGSWRGSENDIGVDRDADSNTGEETETSPQGIADAIIHRQDGWHGVVTAVHQTRPARRGVFEKS